MFSDISLLARFAAFIIFGLTVISAYYAGSLHNEAATGSFGYFLTLGTLWMATAGFLSTGKKNEASLGAPALLGAFLATLAVTACFAFSKSGISSAMGTVLFFKAVGYVILPVAIAFLSYGFGARLLSTLGTEIAESPDLQRIVRLGVGFSAFASLVAVLGFFGFYHIYAVSILFIGIAGLSYREIGAGLVGFWKFRFSTGMRSDSTKKLIVLWTSSFFVFCLFTLVSVNLVNVVRPFPIGWDDLGVYMNYAKIMAYTGSNGGLGMTLWQTFTGIGHLFHSTPQAFFLNEMGTLLSVFALFFGIRHLLDNKPKLLSLPLIGATIFMAMPMVIFQQAKDMKLDTGLFGVSVIALLTFLAALKRSDAKQSQRLMGVAGFLIGIAFAIKFTSLMLILAAL